MVEPLTRVPRAVGATGLPGHLLLLPPELLPGVLLVAPGVRGAGRAQAVHR